MQLQKTYSNALNLWRRYLAILLVLLLALPVAGCNPTKLKTKAAQVPELIVSTLDDPKTFNPAISQEVSPVFGYMFEGLVTENGINGNIEPDLAQAWDISSDHQRFVFTLRPGLKWSDGYPLTADDVVFTYNDIFFNPAIPNNFVDGFRIGEKGELPKVRKLNERQIEFTLPQPFAPFLRATESYILPAHMLKKAVQTTDSQGRPQFLSLWGTDTPPDQIIGNGPYTLKNYVTSQRLVLERNPYYWRRDAQGNPQPYIERVVEQIVQSTDTSLLQFRSGGLDVVGVGAQNFSLLKGEEKRGDFTIYDGGPTGGLWQFICFNLNKGHRKDGTPLVDPIKSRWFNTLEFRQAIAYAIDRQTMLNNTYRGLGVLQNSSITPPSPYAINAAQGLKVYDYNPQKAKQLLLKAGFKYDDQKQLLDAAGNRVRFTLLTSSGSNTANAMGVQIQQDLSKIGIKLDFNPIDFNTLTDKLSVTLQWESYLGLLAGSAIEPNDAANVWNVDGALHSFNQKPHAGTPPIFGREVADWERQINKLYIEGAGELDENKRKAIYAKAQQLQQEYLPYISLIVPLSLEAVRNRFEGIKFSSFDGAFWNIYEIKVVKE